MRINDSIISFNNRYNNFKSTDKGDKYNLKTNRKQIFRLQKKIILFNAIFFFLVWANANIDINGNYFNYLNQCNYAEMHGGVDENRPAFLKTESNDKSVLLRSLERIVVIKARASCLEVISSIENDKPKYLFGIPIYGVNQLELLIGFLFFTTVSYFYLLLKKSKECYIKRQKCNVNLYIFCIEKKIMVKIFKTFKNKIKMSNNDEKYINLKNKYIYMIDFMEKKEEERDVIAKFIERSFFSFSCLLSIIIVFIIISLPMITIVELELLEIFQFRNFFIIIVLCAVSFFIIFLIELFFNIHTIYTLYMFKFNLSKLRSCIFKSEKNRF